MRQVLLFLDVETTGLELEDRICSLGLIVVDNEKTIAYHSLVKPPRKIKPEAMAVHHITNEMVKNIKTFSSSDIFKTLEQYNTEKNILIAHNINFELEMLSKEGLLWCGGIVDTLRCSKHLIEEIEQFSLQYLRYELGLYRQEVGSSSALGIKLQAHSALSDAFHVKMLLSYLMEMADIDALMEYTTEQVLLKKFSFGKYKGRYIEEVALQDVGYLNWLLNQEIDDDLSYSIKYYL